jgi:hypothetical protein
LKFELIISRQSNPVEVETPCRQRIREEQQRGLEEEVPILSS